MSRLPHTLVALAAVLLWFSTLAPALEGRWATVRASQGGETLATADVVMTWQSLERSRPELLPGGESGARVLALLQQAQTVQDEERDLMASLGSVASSGELARGHELSAELPPARVVTGTIEAELHALSQQLVRSYGVATTPPQLGDPGDAWGGARPAQSFRALRALALHEVLTAEQAAAALGVALEMMALQDRRREAERALTASLSPELVAEVKLQVSGRRQPER